MSNMKSFYLNLFYIILVFVLVGCQQSQQTLTDSQKEIIKKEVKEQFNQLVSTLNKKDPVAWSDYYSKDDFLSTIVSIEYFAKRNEWVDTITKYFAMRESQKIELIEVRVTPLTSNLALMTSEEKSEMKLKSGESIKSIHVFTMLWKKEQAGWKVQHSHESFQNEKIN